VALARAWALEPELLILDEPTASLDPASSREVERIIGEIAAAGARILMTTHNLGQAKRLAEDIVFIDRGRIVEQTAGRAISSTCRRPKRRNAFFRRKPHDHTSPVLFRPCRRGLLAAIPAQAQERFITVSSTTSTEQSGLFGHLLPAFEKASGIKVRVVALGTGQALDMARRGDADVVFVHDKVAEEKFIAEGFGVKRQEVMYNDFVVIGPKADPAKAAGKDILEGLRRSRPRRRPSSRAATRAAPTPPSCATGRPPASTSTRPRGRGTATPAPAWARR
jgi:hypothetical protein